MHGQQNIKKLKISVRADPLYTSQITSQRRTFCILSSVADISKSDLSVALKTTFSSFPKM